MAFRRVKTDAPRDDYQSEGDTSVWVLINCSDAPQAVPEEAVGALLFDSEGADAAAPIAPYAYRILRCED